MNKKNVLPVERLVLDEEDLSSFGCSSSFGVCVLLSSGDAPLDDIPASGGGDRVVGDDPGFFE